MTENTRESVKAVLKDMWFNNLAIKEIDDDSDFFELGGDSMAVISILTRIHEVFDVKISLEEFLMHRNFNAQVEIIYNKVLSLC